MIDDRTVLDRWGHDGLVTASPSELREVSWLNERELHWLRDVGLPENPRGGWFATNRGYIQPEVIKGHQFLILGRFEPNMAKYALDSSTHHVVAFATVQPEMNYINHDIDMFVHFLYAFCRYYEFVLTFGTGPHAVVKASELETELRILDPAALIKNEWWAAVVDDITSNALDG